MYSLCAFTSYTGIYEMNQQDALLTYLRRHNKGVTTWVAFDQLGITCLWKRISELEAKGHKIARYDVHGVNRYGNACKVTRYILEAH